MSFVIGSYRAIEHPGGGHRASTAGLWRGEDLRTRNDVAMTVLPAECADAARLAVDSVGALSHPHLLPVVEVTQDEDRAAVICPWPAGGRLAELVRRRGRLTVGETLTVLIPVAAALAVTHAAGIRHGEVCPESLWFDANGRPLLGAPAVSRLIAELNDGLPAGNQDVAPEVIRGEKLPERPITPAADVFSLGSVALFCLTGRSAWPADDAADVLIQSAAGLWPDLSADAAPPTLVALVREMLDAEPERRPSAASLAVRLGRAGQPRSIVFSAGPAPVPASADRWRGWRDVDADRDPGAASDEDPRTSTTPADGHSHSDDRNHEAREPVRPPVGRAGFARRSTTLARAGIALLVGLLVTVVGLQVGLWWTGYEEPGSSAAADPADSPAAALSEPVPVGNQSWSDVVVGLDAARGRALDAADPALLADVYLDGGSAAGTADAAVVQHLADNGLRVVDGVHQIVSVAATTLSATGSSDEVLPPDAVRLAVVDTLPAHPIVDAAGRQVGLTQARAEQRRILVLTLTGSGYRISSVQAG